MNCRIACCGEHIALKTRGILRDCKVMLAGKLLASIRQTIHEIYAKNMSKKTNKFLRNKSESQAVFNLHFMRALFI